LTLPSHCRILSADSENSEIYDVAKLRKIILFSSLHRLAGKEDLTPQDFRKEMFMAPWEIEDKMIIEAVSSYTRPYGFVPELRFVKNHESLITCVRNNMGVAIVDDWVWAKDSSDLRWIPMSSTDTVSIGRMKSKTDEATIFMENILKEVIAEQELTSRNS